MEHPHCLSPSRQSRPVDAPVTASSYGRLFPDLPRFTADDAFLFALGRAGGLSDCQTDVDDERSLGREAAGGSRPDSSSVLNAPSDWQASASLIDLLTCEVLVS